MKIFVNDSPLMIDSPITLTGLLERIGRKAQNTALAVNGEVVVRSEWHQTRVGEGDRITLIEATAGG